jgi:thrombospondin type 3 repeat protein
LRRALLAVTVLAAALAHASSIFPPEVRTHLALSYTPACTLCHNTPSGGFGTVTTPFGKSMIARGLVAQNLQSLDTALDALAAEKKDSDGDGVPDIDELKAGTDPNVAGGGTYPPPSYGCFDVSGQGGSPLALLPVALAFFLAALRLRRA